LTVREKNIGSKLTGAVTEKRIRNSLVSGLGDPCNSDVLMNTLDHVGWAIFAVYLMHRFIIIEPLYVLKNLILQDIENMNFLIDKVRILTKKPLIFP